MNQCNRSMAVGTAHGVAGEAPTALVRAALLKIVVLLALAAWMFWPELCGIARTALGDGDWAHALAAPVLIALLVLRRRRILVAGLTPGSAWGLLLILSGLLLYAACTWPFQYGYPRDAALVPVVAGIVLISAGWRVLQRCLPMLLVLSLSIPIGPRIWAALIIRPETHTLKVARAMLDRLPGVEVRLDGPDLDFTRGPRSGTVAPGEPRRGASLLLTYAVIGVFVTFARVRPSWQVALLALLAVPVVMVCNLFRLLVLGLIGIYASPGPLSPVPRTVASILALLLAYGLFVAAGAVVSRLVVETDEPPDSDDEPEERRA